VGSLRVITRYVPAETAQVLAGDFYGVMPTPEGGAAILVGDVAGHGPSAAAIATHLRAAWRGMAGAGVSPEGIMQMLNDRLVAEQRRPGVSVRFATVSIATISPDNATASLLIAGHPPPVLAAGGAAWELPLEPQPAIGLHETYEWHAQEVELPPARWTMIMYTDGLVEGQTADGERPFGLTRLLPTIAARGPAFEEEDLDAVLSTVELENGGPLPDDVVVVAVSRHTDAAG
jgi:serine phosphatase RsbU (regulator of sigma subunit)